MFTSRRPQGSTTLLLRPVMGLGDDERVLVRSGQMKLSADWSPADGTFVYVTSDPGTRLDTWIKPAEGDARAFLASASNEMQPTVRPTAAGSPHVRRERQ